MVKEQGHAARHGADPQEEKQHGGEDGDVAAGDDEGVEGSGGAIVFGPHAVEFGGGADEDGLHHSVGISVVGVEFVEAVERGGADGEDHAGDAVSAAARENVNSGSVTGGVPVNLLAGEDNAPSSKVPGSL